MKILFDQGVPFPLKRCLPGHMIHTAADRGWSNLANGALLIAAEQDGFDLFITTDQNMKYQQGIAGRKLAILVLLTTSWPRIQRQTKVVQLAIDSVAPGAYVEVVIT